jgi:hypothetical protein
MMLSGSARAELTRVRVSVEDLPRQDEPIEIDGKNAVLPDGAREGGPVPKSWLAWEGGDSELSPSAHCTEDRRGSVGTLIEGLTSTRKIWEANGKVWLDSADIATKTGSVHVNSAERIPVARIADGIWGYRHKTDVTLLAAADIGFLEEGTFVECRISDHTVGTPAGTAIIDSSPKDVNRVLQQQAEWMRQAKLKPKWRPEWKGVEFRAMVSVSKASSDPAPMLNVVMRTP